jgi:cytidylate kinase
MTLPDITIAVDGFSATGKSTFAKLVAKDFGFLYLDSGAMYRAVTLFAQENGMIDADSNIDLDALKAALDKGLDIHFEHTEDGCKTFIGERCVEKDIRTMAVSNQVSPVSAVGFVRNFVDDKLHAFSAAGRVIMDGRDIGTTVFPSRSPRATAL